MRPKTTEQKRFPLDKIWWKKQTKAYSSAFKVPETNRKIRGSDDMFFLDASHFRTMVQTPLYKKLKCCCCSAVSMQVHPPRGHTANILQGPSIVSSLVASTTRPCSCKFEATTPESECPQIVSKNTSNNLAM